MYFTHFNLISGFVMSFLRYVFQVIVGVVFGAASIVVLSPLLAVFSKEEGDAPIPATSQTLLERAAEVSGESFVRAFLGNCAQNMGNFDIIVKAGKALGFTDLPEEMKPLLAPQDSNAKFVGYYAQSGDGAPYFLGVTKADLEGRSFTICAVSNPYIETAQVVSALEKMASIGAPDNDESAMGQRYRVWLVNQWSQGAFISLTDAEPMGYGGATLSMAAPSLE
jgi:hypothetical protein